MRLWALAPYLAAPALIVSLGVSNSAGASPSRATQLLARHSHAVSAGSASLQITQIEYRLILSHAVVKAGPVDLQAIDRGSEPHDLRLLALSSHRETRAPELTPGQRWNGVVDLKPGRYNLWCSLPEHAKRGMHTTLEVVP